MASDLFKKYIWLVDIVHRHGPLTFTEINRRWHQSTPCNGSNIAPRTFHNHRKAVEELFNIRIACDEKTNRYYTKMVANSAKTVSPAGCSTPFRRAICSTNRSR